MMGILNVCVTSLSWAELESMARGMERQRVWVNAHRVGGVVVVVQVEVG